MSDAEHAALALVVAACLLAPFGLVRLQRAVQHLPAHVAAAVMIGASLALTLVVSLAALALVLAGESP